MNAALKHRGPDDTGQHSDPTTGATLAARRLSIIDVAGGHQPLSNEAGTVWAVLNGEIYNHPALQARLRRDGHLLRSQCDTEVLVHLYEELGDDLVHALEGMFAFAILDTARKRLLLGRDRFGEKPLFYAERQNELWFSSELTSLLEAVPGPQELDLASVDDFFNLGYVPGPATMVEDVASVPAGHILSWELGGTQSTLTAYWKPPATAGATGALRFDELVAETEHLLREAVRSRLVSDVKLGVLLSGGLDSALIAAVARAEGPVRTFTVGYDDDDTVDERLRAAGVAAALDTEHHELRIASSEVLATTEAALAAIDQPIADPALIALNAVCRFAREHVTVALGGEGADELFGGYPRYRWLARAEQIPSNAPSAFLNAVARRVENASSGRVQRLADVLRPRPTVDRHLHWVSSGRHENRAALFGPLMDGVRGRATVIAGDHLEGNLPLERRLMLLDQHAWLVDDVLAKADRAGMLASLEVRTPFLQRALVEFAASVPVDRHLRGGGKALLRGVLERVAPSVSPEAKTAFRVPLAEWLQGPLALTMRHQITDGAAYRCGLLNAEAVGRLLEEHAAGAADHSALLWPCFVFSMWMTNNGLGL